MPARSALRWVFLIEDIRLQRRAFRSGLEVDPITGPLADALNLPPKAEGLMV